MITRSTLRRCLKGRRKVEEVIQIRVFLLIGLFGLIGSDRKPKEPTELNLVGFRFQPNHNRTEEASFLVWSVWLVN